MTTERLRSKRALVLLAEALAIGLGVFLSLWADEWRTNQNEAAESRGSLARLAQNLSNDTAEFVRLSGLNERSVDAIRSILATNPAHADAPSQMAELIPFTLESSIRNPSGQEYEALQSSGRLGLVSNAELLGALAQYYERQQYVAELFRLDGEQSHAVAELMYPHVEFPRDVFTLESSPETSSASTPSFYPVPAAAPSVTGLLSDRVFVNEMTYLGLLKQLLTNAILELRALADGLLEMIELELAR